jgi:hypothetical protein
MGNDDVDPVRALRETQERSIGVSVPILLSQRLDELVRLTETAGARLYRKDLVAALLLAAPEDPEELLQLFLRYRKATAAEAAIGDATEGTVLKLERPKPGRRPRAS